MKSTLDHLLLAVAGFLLVLAWVAVILITGRMYWGFDDSLSVATPDFSEVERIPGARP
jgi:hypothetical protein